MPDQVQFEGEGDNYSQRRVAEPMPMMVRWVLSTGIVQDEDDARYLLMGVAVLAAISAIIIIFFFASGPTRATSPFKEGQSILIPSQPQQ